MMLPIAEIRGALGPRATRQLTIFRQLVRQFSESDIPATIDTIRAALYAAENAQEAEMLINWFRLAEEANGRRFGVLIVLEQAITWVISSAEWREHFKPLPQV